MAVVDVTPTMLGTPPADWIKNVDGSYLDFSSVRRKLELLQFAKDNWYSGLLGMEIL